MSAIAPHGTATDDGPWDGPAQEAKLSNDAGAATYRKAYAWVDPEGDPDAKSSYRFIHHFVTGPTEVGAASTRACSSAIGVLNGGRGGSTIPGGDRQGVYNHLARHLRDAGLEPPALSADGGERRYRRILDYVFRTAWAMHPAALTTIMSIIEERSLGFRPTEEELARRIAGGRHHETRDNAPARNGSVAVIPLVGSIYPRAEAVDNVSQEGTSAQEFSRKFRAALDAPDVSSIVLDVDSPGGSADLVPETAAEIFAARGTKPIVAVANTWAASAAYWISSAADELVVTPSGEVGSIGVYAAHQDRSAEQEAKGIRTTLVSAGKFKTEGNPFGPLDEEAHAELQRRVDHTYAEFLGAVARHRDVSVDTVEERFGQGRMVRAEEAVRLGMADRVATLEETIARMRASSTEEESAIAVRSQVPRTDLVRMLTEDRAQARIAEDGNTLVGWAIRFNEWAMVEARWGVFRERFLPGSLDKTVREFARNIRPLFNHGFDPMLGEKPLGVVRRLEIQPDGLWTETELSQADSVQREIKPRILEGSLDGMSVRMEVISDVWTTGADGIEERSIAEAKIYEFGPVTWPAYEGASIGIRSAEGFARWMNRQTEAVAPPAPGRDTEQPSAVAPVTVGRDTSTLDEMKDALAQAEARSAEQAQLLEELEGT